MSNKYSSDKGMQNLFEGFRRSLVEQVTIFDDEGGILEDELSKLMVKAADGDKQAAQQLYNAADNIKAQGTNFSTADGTPMNKDAIAKAYGLEVGSDAKAQTPPAKIPNLDPEVEKYIDKKTGMPDFERFFADKNAERQARYDREDAEAAKRKAEREARYAKEDEEREARYAKEDEERKARYRR